MTPLWCVDSVCCYTAQCQLAQCVPRGVLVLLLGLRTMASQDAILQDEEKMKEINEKLEKFEMGSSTKCISNDLSKGNMIVSEESSHAIYDMGNMELYELRQISVTIQYHSCLKHMTEGLKFCGCGVCLRPDEDTINRINARFQVLISPYDLARVNCSRGKRTRKCSMATRSLESNGRHERSTETRRLSVDPEQMAK